MYIHSENANVHKMQVSLSLWQIVEILVDDTQIVEGLGTSRVEVCGELIHGTRLVRFAVLGVRNSKVVHGIRRLGVVKQCLHECMYVYMHAVHRMRHSMAVVDSARCNNAWVGVYIREHTHTHKDGVRERTRTHKSQQIMRTFA